MLGQAAHCEKNTFCLRATVHSLFHLTWRLLEPQGEGVSQRLSELVAIAPTIFRFAALASEIMVVSAVAIVSATAVPRIKYYFSWLFLLLNFCLEGLALNNLISIVNDIFDRVMMR